MREDFKCKDCISRIAICFKCKKKGPYSGLETKKRMKEMELNEETITKCSTANCHKFYHRECVVGNKYIKYIDATKTKFRCSIHYCQKCTISGDAMALLQCVRCPSAFHTKCYSKEKVIKLTKKLILCQVIFNLILFYFCG